MFIDRCSEGERKMRMKEKPQMKLVVAGNRKGEYLSVRVRSLVIVFASKHFVLERRYSR